MKTLFIFLALTMTLMAHANEKKSCKASAQVEAVKLYSKQNPDRGFFVREKLKPVTEGEVTYHMVEIQDREAAQTVALIVTVNSKDCGLVSID